MNNNFSENLKKIRKENNLSQEQLAEQLGVSRQAISKWESAAAYPEMDKIILICDKFNLNIDDLLHKDIKEIKNEEESKKNINKYIDDFLNFITNTINMFCSMKFKSKIKCLFEQFIIGIILFAFFLLIGEIIRSLAVDLFWLVPEKAFYVIRGLTSVVYFIFSLICSLMIFTHIFKTRYLNYYEKIRIGKNEEKTRTEDLQNKAEENDKILFQKNEDKIIIRDPKHSEYKFINGIFKIIIAIVKFFAICFSAFLFMTLVFLVGSFIATFLLYKTGLFFVGLLLAIGSLGGITVDFVLIVLNFIFNRKNNKKALIWTIIIFLISTGIGIGLVFIGLTNFEYVEEDQSIIKKDYLEIDYEDDLFLETYYFLNGIEYIESSNTNIKVEYQIREYCEINMLNINSDAKAVLFSTKCRNPISMFNYLIKNLNSKKIILTEFSAADSESLKIYTTKENIKKLKNNKELYYRNNLAE